VKIGGGDRRGLKGRERAGVLGEGAASSLPISYRVWGSTVSSPSGVRGRAPAAQAVLAFYRRQMAFPGIRIVQTEWVSTRISLDVAFYIAKKISSQHFGGGEVNP